MNKSLVPTPMMSLCVFLTLCAGAAAAREEPLRFIHVLQRSGYGDMAAEYLNLLAKRPDLPPEIRDVWELEMSKSLKAAAADAFDTRDYERLIDQSQQHLAKFLKEKPDHPAAAGAQAEWGDFLMRQSLELLSSAKAIEGKDAVHREKYLTDARAGFAKAREKFQQAEAKFKSRLGQLPSPSKPPGKKTEPADVSEARDAAETGLQDAEFQLAWTDYWIAQTYAAKDPQRIAALQKAGRAFDDIFQRNRTDASLARIGLLAHLWQGKTAEELGDSQLAMDIYDEVLGGGPEPGDRSPATGLEPLFAQAEHFRLLVLAKQNPRQFLSEARTWLEQYRRFRQTDGYQGVALELAKAKLAAADNAAGPEKAKRTSEALQILFEMAKIRSQHQREAILLRRDVMTATGRSYLDINSFEEAVALADAAMAASQWDRARDAYRKAIDIAKKQNHKDSTGVKAVQEALDRAQYNLACDLFRKGKLNECMELVGAIVFEDPAKKTVRKDSAAAAEAASLAVTAALNLYVNATEGQKPAALKKLMNVAEFTEKNWPDRPEADDARMARAQAKLVVGQVRDAIDLFERVNPKSERYPLAMYRAGQDYAALYSAEKRKPEKARNSAQMAADRDKAIRRLQTGLAVLDKEVEPGKPLPKYFADAQLLLAEIRAEGGEMREAAALYRPLVDAVKAEKPRDLDEPMVRVFLGAARAHCALGEIDKAADASAVLIDLGPDTLKVNFALTQFARLLDLERKKALATVTELKNTAKVAELAGAKKRLASIETLLGKILVKLAKRRELSLAARVFIADAMNSLGMTDDASREYQKIIERDKTDPAFANSAAGAMTRVRTQLIALLRKQGRFEKALKQVDDLIEDFPYALEPLLEKGYILEGWAEKEPARFDQSVSHWVMLRSRLQPLRPKPPEYYEVMYRVAACLVREAQESKDKATVLDRALKAEQVLKAAMVLSPKLDGPDTVARYRVLLDKAIVLQGRSSTPKDAKKP